MNSAKEVAALIQSLKDSGIPKSEAAWKAARACEGWPYIYGLRGDYDTPEVREKVYKEYPKYTGLVKNCQVLREEDRKGYCSGCKWYPGGCRVRGFDCRGFTYWILLQIYGWRLMGAGCTSQWNTQSNWKAKGEVKDGIPQGVIVCLFYYKKDSSGKRTKTLEHTGLYYNGETIECSSGVQYTKGLNKKWEVWGLPACVEGDAPAPQPEPTDKKPTLRQGDRGTYVTMMQEELQDIGYNIGSSGADGIFGKNTKSAVVAFQTNNGLKADGICGPATWTELDATQPGPEPKPEKDRYTVTIPGVSMQQAEELCKEWSGASMKKE